MGMKVISSPYTTNGVAGRKWTHPPYNFCVAWLSMLERVVNSSTKIPGTLFCAGDGGESCCTSMG
jgi:hypothetical protein